MNNERRRSSIMRYLDIDEDKLKNEEKDRDYDSEYSFVTNMLQNGTWALMATLFNWNGALSNILLGFSFSVGSAMGIFFNWYSTVPYHLHFIQWLLLIHSFTSWLILFAGICKFGYTKLILTVQLLHNSSEFGLFLALTFDAHKSAMKFALLWFILQIQFILPKRRIIAHVYACLVEDFMHYLVFVGVFVGVYRGTVVATTAYWILVGMFVHHLFDIAAYCNVRSRAEFVAAPLNAMAIFCNGLAMFSVQPHVDRTDPVFLSAYAFVFATCLICVWVFFWHDEKVTETAENKEDDAELDLSIKVKGPPATPKNIHPQSPSNRLMEYI